MKKVTFIALLAALFSFSCSSGPEGTGTGDCADDKDNDGDGLIDCEDEGCNFDERCAEIARKAREAEAAAVEARKKSETDAAQKAASDAANPYVVIGDLWVQREHNGKNVALDAAREYCESLKLADHNDWRLPTEAEAVKAAKSRMLVFEAFAMWTSTLRSKKRGVIVGITSGAANELGVIYDGDCRARCVREQ